MISNILVKFDRSIFMAARIVIGAFSPAAGTRYSCRYFERRGLNFLGRPNYISTKAWLDGTDYGLITIGEGVTISSYVSILTHDWALHTIGKIIEGPREEILGRIKPVKIDDYSFLGRSAIIMPGASVGKGCIIAAGAVVRGSIPDFSLVVGNPGSVVGDTRAYFEKKLSRTGKAPGAA